MTLKIGQKYKLPNGVVGIYVGDDGAGHNFAIYAGKNIDLDAYKNTDRITEYREPREWEVEITMWQDQSGIVEPMAGIIGVSETKYHCGYKLIARATVTVKEQPK